MDIGDARPSPGTDWRPGGYSCDSEHLIPRHAPRCPHASLGMPSLAAAEEGGGLTGRWVMVTQITPHHTAYLQPTPNSTAEHRPTATKTGLIENASRFGFII